MAREHDDPHAHQHLVAGNDDVDREPDAGIGPATNRRRRRTGSGAPPAPADQPGDTSPQPRHASGTTSAGRDPSSADRSQAGDQPVEQTSPTRPRRRADPSASAPLTVRVKINYVSGAEGDALRAAQGRALRNLIEALAQQQTTEPDTDERDST